VAMLGAVSLSLNEEKQRPVTKVIQLLKDMQDQLEKEQQDDEETYDRVACWCKVNNKEKSQNIKDAETLITQLTSEIEEHTANSARLATEIENLEGEVAKNAEALKTAQELRDKQEASFTQEEKDLMQSVGALEAAIVVLSKHHTPPKDFLLTVRQVLKKHKQMVDEVITPRQQRMIGAYIQQPTFKQAYKPQSSEIFGILQNMLDTFRGNLSTAQKEEMTDKSEFAELKKAKEDEVNAGQAQLDEKKLQLANTDARNAQAKEDIDDTRGSLSADETFLIEVKEKCASTDAEWQERQKTRREEIQAVSQAIAVLSNDDAHDVFSKTLGFIQVVANPKTRAAAAEVLESASARAQSPRLSMMALKVKNEAMDRVKKAIDDMVTQLQVEKADEIKHRDWCVESLNTNELDTQKSEKTKEALEVSIADLESNINTLSTEIETFRNEINELQVQLKRAGEDREKENKDFQQTVVDQRETQKLLQQALNVLKSFYDKKAEAFMQLRQDPAPEGFKAYKKNEGASSVLVLIQQIIGDAKVMEAEATKAEEDAQSNYETYVKQTNLSTTTKQRAIDNKTEDKAKAEGDKTAAETELKNSNQELMDLSNGGGDIHKSCDFVLKNFDVRQEARDQEVAALGQAKAILSGAQFQTFLQRLS